MKWPQIITVLLGVLAVAFAVRLRHAQTASVPPAPAPALPPHEVGRPLAPSFDQPGVAGRQTGLLRIYVSVTPEAALESSESGAARRLASVPILITLENDTYQPLAGAALGWLGAQLCSVRVMRASTDARDVEVFQMDLPLPARADWLSAERRSFTVDWPVREATPGTYRIAVQLALPDQALVEINLRLL